MTQLRRNAWWPWCLAAALALAACRDDAATPAQAAPAPTPAPMAAAEVPTNPSTMPSADCREADFDRFLADFSRDIAVQETSVADPLTSERYDTSADAPEPVRVTDRIALRDVEWPVMTDIALLARNGRTYEVKTASGDGREVVVRTPDTSDQQVYHFERAPCWTLVRMVDESI